MDISDLFYFYLNACSISASKSAISSTPTLSLTKSSVIPTSSRLSSGMDAWVINAGWLANDSTPPRDSANVNTFSFSKKEMESAFYPVLKVKDTNTPKPLICY